MEGKEFWHTTRHMAMTHSTLTRKGQTTIPLEIRQALNLKPGDRIRYEVEGDFATIRLQGGTKALAGALASDKGRRKNFGQIRQAAAKTWAGRAAQERLK